VAYKYFRKTQIYDCRGRDRFVKTHIRVKNGATARADTEQRWVVVVGDSCISEPTLAAIHGRIGRYPIWVAASGFNLALQLIDKLSQSDEGIR
jgi:hypothetical protein